MRPGAAAPEQIDNFLYRDYPPSHVRKPEASRKGAGKHQLRGAVREGMMGHASIMQAGASEEGPAVDDKLAATHGAQMG